MLQIDVFSRSFRALCEGAFTAQHDEAGAGSRVAARISVHNLRDWARDKHRTTDDVPYGGGQGMVMKPDPIFDAVDALRRNRTRESFYSVPQGRVFRQDGRRRIVALQTHLIFRLRAL